MLQYPWEPHKILRTPKLNGSSGLPAGVLLGTLEEAQDYAKTVVQHIIDFVLYNQIQDLIHIAIQNRLLHNVDSLTQSFADSRIPSQAITTNNTLRFLIAFMYEKQLGFPGLVASQRINDHGPTNTIERYSISFHDQRIFGVVREWTQTAIKITEIMEDVESKISSGLAQQPDFIRSAALINLGKKTGLLMETAANRIGFNTGHRDDTNNVVTYFLEPNKSFYIDKLMGLRIPGTRSNQTDTLTITAKNGPSQLTSRTVATNTTVKSVLAKDASKTLTNSELDGTIILTTDPILVPVATRELPDITDLEVAEVQSVNIDNLFSGLRVVTTAASSDDSKVTVSINDQGTSMGVTGVAIGTSTITMTGTNEAGNETVTFDVTIVAAD